MHRGVRPLGGFIRASDDDKDSFINKLVKYVPVEGLAPLIPAAAMAETDGQVKLAFAGALVLGLVLIIAQNVGKTPSPRIWYWPFVGVGFLAWSVGASAPFRDLLDVTEKSGAFYLALSAALLPSLDIGLEKIFPGPDVPPVQSIDPRLGR